MFILSIESSCDETSAAVVSARQDTSGREIMTILSNKVASQIELHRRWGGVVPEIASRAHTEAVTPLTYAALEEAGVTMADIDAVAVTNRPGLIGALLVGLSFAKGLAYSYGKPLIAVNHIFGHNAANYFGENPPSPPYLAAVVSGGHTSLYDVRGYTDFKEIGSTRDDAAGEAFDKIARVLGMPYPGGIEMDALAYEGDKNALRLPSAALAGDTFDFSFSGLKTFVINYVNTKNQRGEEINRADIAASVCYCVAESITRRITEAAAVLGYNEVALSGGVAANSHLRASLGEACDRLGLTLHIPPKPLCGDNGAMIGAQGVYEYLAGNIAGIDLNAYPD